MTFAIANLHLQPSMPFTTAVQLYNGLYKQKSYFEIQFCCITSLAVSYRQNESFSQTSGLLLPASLCNNFNFCL